MIKKNCKFCSKEFEIYPGRAKITIFCSMECFHKFPKSSQIIKKLSKSQKGKKLSKETRRKISLAKIGKHLSEDHKMKISESARNNPTYGMRGKSQSEETKKKLSEINKGKILSAETRKKMSESRSGKKHYLFGKHLSEERKNNHIKRMKGKKYHLGHFNTEESKRKMSARRQGIPLEEWTKFTSRDPYDQNWTPKFKRSVRKRDNQICLKCGIHREKIPRALDVHHINYDKQMSLLQNCCALCGKCNSEVNKNRIQWTKFFQSLLAEKYGYQYSENNEIILEMNLK